MKQELSLHSEVQKFAVFSILSISVLSFGFVALPHFFSLSYAADTPVETSAVTLSVNPIDPVNRYDLKIVDPGPDGVFNTIGIEAKVSTENTYGYQLSMRSKTAGAKLVNKSSEYASESFITPIGSSIDVDYRNNRFFNEKNAYGWSTNWDPNNQTGTFNPIANHDTVVKKTIAATSNDVTNIYLGTLITEDLMFGKYDGTIVLTAVTNSYNDTHTTYQLIYDSNAVSGAVSNMPISPVDKEISVAQTDPVYFELNTTTIPSRSDFNFKGWDTNRNATSATYRYENSSWNSPTYVEGAPAVYVNLETTTLYAVWTQSFSLAFNANGGTGGPGTMNCESTSSYCEFTIPNTEPTGPGEFVGWATTSMATEPEYIAGSTYRVESTAPNATLYAVYEVMTFDKAFERAGKTKLNGYYKMQDMADVCSLIPTPTTATEDISTQLIDTRDGEIYLVKKLADGKCWMAENLRLGGDTPITLTSEDTNLQTFSSGTGTTWTLPASTRYFNTIGDIAYTSPLLQADYKETIQGAVGVAPAGKIGNYYNLCAASAGTNCKKDTATSGSSVVYDICPKGWRLPTARYLNTDYVNLYSAYSNNVSNLLIALNITLSGSFPTSSTTYPKYEAINQGTHAWFWSSTYEQSKRVVLGVYDTSRIETSQTTNASIGATIRCVANNTSVSMSAPVSPLGEDTIDLPENVLEVIRLINSLPKPEDVKLSDGELIERVRAAFEALTDEEKALINPELLKKYNSVLAAYYSLVDADSSNDKLIVAACAGAAITTTTLTILLIAKKREEDDEEES